MSDMLIVLYPTRLEYLQINYTTGTGSGSWSVIICGDLAACMNDSVMRTADLIEFLINYCIN